MQFPFSISVGGKKMSERPGQMDDGIYDDEAEEATLSDAEIVGKYADELAALKMCSPLICYRLMLSLVSRRELSRFHKQSMRVLKDLNVQYVERLQTLTAQALECEIFHKEMISAARGQSDDEIARMMNTIHARHSPFGVFALKQLGDEVVTRYNLLNSRRRSSIEYMLRKKPYGSHTNHDRALAAAIRADHEDCPTTNPHMQMVRLSRLPNTQT